MFGWFKRGQHDLHPDVRQLSERMRAIESLLRSEDHTGWADEVARCADLVEQSDAYGLERFLKLYGGMGSINDVVLYRDGTLLNVETDQLHRLLVEAATMGRQLRNERH
jgi:hypothetical protein